MTKTELQGLFARAHSAGLAAGNAAVPTPIRFVEHEDPLDDRSPITRAYPVITDGECGFAWVTIHPGNCAAANYARKHLDARTSYYGGCRIWISAFGQSMARKAAYASAFADELRSAGIRAYSESRLD